MTHILVHAHRKEENHTSWRQIRIFKNYLESRGVDVVMKDYEHISCSNRDTLTIFCSGLIEESVVDASHFAKKVYIVTQDLNWPVHLHSQSGSRLRKVDCSLHPFTRVKKLSDHLFLTSSKDQKILRKSHSRFVPFGALNALDEEYVNQLMHFHDDEVSSKLEGIENEIVYLGSMKQDREEDLMRVIESSDRVSLVGRYSEEFMSRAPSNVTFRGWVPPEAGLYVYSRAGENLVITDHMTKMGLDYNRPYELSMARSEPRVVGPYINEYMSLNSGDLIEKAHDLKNALDESNFLERLYS